MGSAPRVKPPTRWLSAGSLAGIVLFLALTSCHQKPTQSLGDDTATDFGKPNAIIVPSVPDDHLNVAFALITDTHLDCSYAGEIPDSDHIYRDTYAALRNRYCVDYLNSQIHKPPWGLLNGVVHLGDMIDIHSRVQYLISLRQYWEHDYPGIDGGAIAGASDSDYNAYCLGHRTELVMFPGLGNHDVPNPSAVSHYVEYYDDDLIRQGTGIKRYYESNELSTGPVITAYTWRWGKYYFVQLGQWAGSGLYKELGYTDTNKLEWLGQVLADDAGDSLGVVLFQHYGFDTTASAGYWNTDQQRMMLNVLCRRPIDDTTWRQPDARPPYKVLGVFTGHTHEQSTCRVYAGLAVYDTLVPNLGDTMWINNVVLRATGKLDADGSGNYGFSIVELTARQLGQGYDFDPMKVHDAWTSDGSTWTWDLREPELGWWYSTRENRR